MVFVRNNATTLYSLILVIGDVFVLIASFVIAYILRVKVQSDLQLVNEVAAFTYLKVFLALLPFWIIIFASLGLYNEKIYTRKYAEFGRLLIGSFIGILFVIGYDFVTDEPIFPARLVPVYGLVLSFSLLVLARLILWQLRRTLFKYGWWVNRVMIIGSGSSTKDLIRLLGHTDTSGYNIVGVVSAKQSLPRGYSGKQFSTIDEGLSALGKLNVHTLIQTKLYESEDKNRQIARAALNNHIAYKFVPSQSGSFSGRTSLELFHYYPMIAVHQTPLLGWGRIAKRGFDFIVSLITLIILLPVFLMIAVIMKLTDRGPVIFKQKRLTRFGHEVDIFKFRTMKVEYSGRDAVEVFNEMGREDLAKEYVRNRNKVTYDPRVKAFGRFLRQTSLDELPQLINVLNGDISLVGPRSIPDEELDDFKTQKPILVSVKTGITGLAQVSGRSSISMEERVRLDIYYVQNWTFMLDLRIQFRTIFVVLGGGNSK